MIFRFIIIYAYAAIWFDIFRKTTTNTTQSRLITLLASGRRLTGFERLSLASDRPVCLSQTTQAKQGVERHRRKTASFCDAVHSTV